MPCRLKSNSQYKNNFRVKSINNIHAVNLLFLKEKQVDPLAVGDTAGTAWN
jgi:hypothetical protein